MNGKTIPGKTIVSDGKKNTVPANGKIVIYSMHPLFHKKLFSPLTLPAQSKSLSLRRPNMEGGRGKIWSGELTEVIGEEKGNTMRGSLYPPAVCPLVVRDPTPPQGPTQPLDTKRSCVFTGGDLIFYVCPLPLFSKQK